MCLESALSWMMRAAASSPCTITQLSSALSSTFCIEECSAVDGASESPRSLRGKLRTAGCDIRTSVAGSMAISLYLRRISRNGCDLVDAVESRSTGHILDACTESLFLLCATIMSSAAAPSRHILTHSLEPKITSRATMYWLLSRLLLRLLLLLLLAALLTSSSPQGKCRISARKPKSPSLLDSSLLALLTSSSSGILGNLSDRARDITCCCRTCTSCCISSTSRALRHVVSLLSYLFAGLTSSSLPPLFSLFVCRAFLSIAKSSLLPCALSSLPSKAISLLCS